MFIHKPPKIKIPEIYDTTTEDGRTYKVDGGKIYPSITTVLSINDQEWLTEWRNAVGEPKAREISDIATIQGNAVHDMAEKYLDNEAMKDILINREEEHKFMFHQLRLELKHINNIVLQEVGLYSHVLKTAGRVDCIGEYKGMPAIIDFKTSSNIKERDKISNYFKQGAAYSLMWYELTGITIDKVVILMAVKNSLSPLCFIEPVDKWINPLQSDINRFLSSAHKLEVIL